MTQTSAQQHVGTQFMHYLRINDKYVGEAEITFVRGQIKAKLVSDLQSEYGIPYNQQFWQTDLGGYTPAQLLEARVIEQVVRNSIYEGLLKENDLLPYKDFEDFNNLLYVVNEERRKAVNNKQVIYGPVQYSQMDYYHYLISNSLIKLKKHYIDTASIPVTDDLLRAFEVQNPGVITKEPDTFKVKLISLAYTDPTGIVDEEKQLTYKKVMEILYEQCQQGRGIEECIEDSLYALTVQDKTFGGACYRTDAMTHPNLLRALRELEEGDYTSVIQANGAYHIAYLVQKIAGEKRPFESYKDFLATKYVELVFEQLVDQKIKEAKIEVLHPIPTFN